MCTIKRLIVLICTTALCVCLFANAKARADTYPTAPEILDTVLEAGDLTSIANAYVSLTYDQRLICNYIIGAYNNVYLCARGFSYDIDETESDMKAQFLAMGETVWNYATTAYGWRSRFNEVFRQYMSSAIVYAHGISTTFDAWYNGIRYGGNSQLYIPYSQDAFDAWTTFYNDPSGDGISYFGANESAWDFGILYDYEFAGIPFFSSNIETVYNNFILNYSPVLYSGTSIIGQNSYQVIVGLNNITCANAVYILNGSTYQYFRYGVYSSGNHSIVSPQQIPYGSLTFAPSYNKVDFSAAYGPMTYTSFNNNIISGNASSDLGTFVNSIGVQPFYVNTSVIQNYSGYYPLIEHVFLVDDLNTLSNPVEVYNTDDLGILAPVNDNFIIAPNGRMILPIWPYADDDPMGFWDIIQENSYNVETELPATDDDYHNSIVNNTTINNYYVSDDTKINVPANWFDNEHTDLLAEDSVPFFEFAHDCIDTLGDLQLYMYGAIVIGLGGGIVKKLLL